MANWFFLSFIITVAMLHLVNGLPLVPVSWTRDQELRRSGAASRMRMTQWWYGHNAVGFFLTAGLPGDDVLLHPQAARSGRSTPTACRSIHFWSLIFLYIWAGPHHLHYSALPDWAQTTGHGVLGDAVDALLGRHDQRNHDPLRRLAQTAHGPDPADHGHLGRLLRDEHLRRPGDVHQGGQLPEPLSPTGPSATSIPAPWAGWPWSASGPSTYLVPAAVGIARGSTP